MQKFRVQGPDGQSVVIEAESPEAAKRIAQEQAKPKPNTNPGVSPEAPPDMILNPNTGQYTSRELLANAQDGGRGQAALVGGAHGLTFGGADEALGAANAVIPGAGTAAERYTFGRENARAIDDSARENFPITRGASEVGGGLATALSYGLPAIAGRGMGGAMLAGAGVGAAEGAGYGFLSGEGGAADRVQNALTFGLLGGAAGGAAPVATSLARQGYRAAGDVVGGGIDLAVGKGRQGRANRALASTLERSGMSVDDLGASLTAASRDGQGVFRAADALGQAGQRRMSGIVRSGGDASQEIADFLRSRQIDQPERVAGFVEDAFDARQSAAATKSSLTAQRSATADAAYEAARGNSAPVDIRNALDAIDDRIGGMQGSGVAGDSIDGRLASFRSRLAAQPGPDGVNRELSDFNRVLGVKQDVSDAIGAAVRAGRNNEARELTRLRDALDAALEEASEGYRAANDGFREASRVINAVDEGTQMARPGARAVDTTAQFSNMTPEQQAAARVGYADRALARVESSAGEMTNRARPFTSTKAREEAAAMATDPALFARRIGRENTMHDTMGRALGGSRTADNLEDIADLRSYDTGMLANILTGNWRTAGAQAMQGASDTLTGMTPETRRIIAQALMAKDETAFRKALAQAETSDARKQIADALLRMTAQKSGYAGLAQQ